MSIEELMDVNITTVTRKPERARETAAAVHVITREAIRRSGARNIPEALRLAPNLQVARIDARSWAISARGFQAAFSNKLLVLIDGRTVYTPLFSGVFWDAQDTLLEDVERIEVISGPGGTLWGANAVNGIINIVTKSAKETHGALLSAGGGSQERAFGEARYGGSAGEDLDYRVYAKHFDRSDSSLEGGVGAGDAWSHGQGGFRLDWTLDPDESMTFQGDIYDGQDDDVSDDRSFSEQSGGNLLARWQRALDQDSSFTAQMYYDRTNYRSEGEFGDELDTYDLDTQYDRRFSRHRLIAGAGYRYTQNNIRNYPGLAFLPERLERDLFSAFVQDEIALIEETLHLTLGTKYEHNDYTGSEIQPSVRVGWTSDPHFVWGAVSRAVRTPSRIDRNLFAPETPPYVLGGGPEFDSESVIAYELGWRSRIGDSALVSIAAFHNDYDDIRSLTLSPPILVENDVEAEVNGVELSSTWQPLEWLRLFGGYTYLHEDFWVEKGGEDLSDGLGEAFDPEHQFQVRSSFDLSETIQLDLWYRYVDRLGNRSARGFGTVPQYETLDVRLAWLAMPSLELAVVGQNLLEKRHGEFGSRFEVERGIYGQVTLRR